MSRNPRTSKAGKSAAVRAASDAPTRRKRSSAATTQPDEAAGESEEVHALEDPHTGRVDIERPAEQADVSVETTLRSHRATGIEELGPPSDEERSQPFE